MNTKEARYVKKNHQIISGEQDFTIFYEHFTKLFEACIYELVNNLRFFVSNSRENKWTPTAELEHDQKWCFPSTDGLLVFLLKRATADVGKRWNNN